MGKGRPAQVSRALCHDEGGQGPGQWLPGPTLRLRWNADTHAQPPRSLCAHPPPARQTKGDSATQASSSNVPQLLPHRKAAVMARWGRRHRARPRAPCVGEREAKNPPEEAAEAGWCESRKCGNKIRFKHSNFQDGNDRALNPKLNAPPLLGVGVSTQPALCGCLCRASATDRLS